MKNIVCGIIGSGVIAPTHIQSYLQIPGVTVKYACDLVPAKARQMVDEQHALHAVTDYRQVLADPEVDCVSICTDHASHGQIVADALDAGKHVICEKCLAATPEQLQMMLDAHQRHPELIFSGIFQHRYEPSNIVLKQLIEAGKFGRILTACLHVACLRTDEYYNADAWRGTWAQEGGSVLINQTIHHFDLLRYFLGEVKEVSVTHSNLVHADSIETEDTIVAAMRFESGALVSYIATSGSQAATWRSGYAITGTEGYLEYAEFQPVFLNFVRPGVTEEVENAFRNCAEDQAKAIGKVYYGTAHPAQIADFIHSVRTGEAPLVTGEEAAKTARVVHACYESARTGKWVAIR